MSATKLTLEWTKFLILLLTTVFIFLTIGFAQEVQGVKTTLSYLGATSAYYMMNDALFIDLFTKWPLLSRIGQFECREAIYGRLCLKVASLLLSCAVHLSLLLVTSRFKLFLCGVYVNVYLRAKDLVYNEVTTLALEDESIEQFRVANKADISEFDDVCAICLGDMRHCARVTACRHLFHDHCLSLAIQSSPNCPTCKSLL